MLFRSNSSLKFLTGDRTFRLIDNDLNDVPNAYTYAEATYVAKGTIQTHQRSVVSVAQPIVVSSAAPVSTPYQAPAKPSVSIAVQGRASRYITIPYNVVATASSSSTYGVITNISIYGRSANPDINTGSWVLINSSSPNSYTATLTARETIASGEGVYQHKAEITVNGITYTSNLQGPIWHYNLPAELIGVPNDGSSTFYY